MFTLGRSNSSVYSDGKPDQSILPQQPPPRPTIVLVHGGWQGPETYSLLVPRLEKAGYSVFAVSLPSTCTVPAVPDFSSDVSAVRNAVTSTLATGKDVVLVMHSYGALVGCEALKGIKVDEAASVMAPEGALRVGKVIKLAFIAGLLLPEGKATYEIARGSEAMPGFECEDNLVRVTDGQSRFYNDLPSDSALQWASRLKKHSRLSDPPSASPFPVSLSVHQLLKHSVDSAFASPLTYAAYRDFPTSYLMCVHDKGVPFPIQKRFVAMAGIKDVTKITSGHSPMVSQPKVVEMFVRKSAGEVVAKL